jgi:lysophospholipase L1-like esterase
MPTYNNSYWRLVSSLTVSAGLLSAPLFAGNDKITNYLALGDSVAYGLDIRLLANQPPPTPDQFVGYPETVAAFERLNSNKEVNASCPGETSGSFIDVKTLDFGCNFSGPDGEPPFKTSIGLHTNYSGPQLSFALSQLSTNKQIDLITLGIGSNDIFLLLRDCANDQTCVATRLPGVLSTYRTNLTKILTAIRGVYGGTLVLVKYYSPSSDLTPLALQLNSVMVSVGSQFGVRFADGFLAFQLASALFGGDPCKAGLLIPLSSTTCDIHPSPRGRDLLAATVEVALLPFK